jgi:membrane-associated phospholipid phosphatase
MQQLAHGPIEVAIGLSFGIGWGILLMYFPHKDDVSIYNKPKVSGLMNSNVYFPV